MLALLGFLEDSHLERVPGTALLSDLGVVRGHQVRSMYSTAAVQV